MIRKIDHIGIVVKDLDASMRMYVEDLKLPFVRQERNPEFNVDIAFFRCGEVLVELLCPYGPGMNQDFLNATGGGIHHIAYEVDNIENMYMEIADTLGHKDTIKPGAGNSRIFFADPQKAGNVETEFVELP